MRKVIRAIYAFAMLGIMLYAVFFYGPESGTLNLAKIGSAVTSMAQNGLSGLQTAVSSGISSASQPIPTQEGTTSVPSLTGSSSQVAAAASDYAATGMDGLSVYTYGRTLLSAEGKEAYDQVQSGLLAMKTAVYVTSSLSPVQMQTVIQYLISDHPEVFYLGKTSLSYSLGVSTTYTVHFTYSYDAAAVASMRGQLRTAALSMLAEADGTTDAEKKELALHDALVDKCAYNVKAAENTSAYPLAFTAYGAIVNGSAVCEGYAKALKLLLDSAGLRSLYVTGEAASGSSSGAHAWNEVYVGKWVQVDATFDDPVYLNASGQYVQMAGRSYTYFNFVSKADHVLGVFDSANPFSSDSENYATMPSLG